jgi:hypothetical protein
VQIAITINCQNAAFGETEPERADEIARILNQIAKRFTREGVEDFPVIDSNGNRVGSVLAS